MTTTRSPGLDRTPVEATPIDRTAMPPTLLEVTVQEDRSRRAVLGAALRTEIAHRFRTGCGRVVPDDALGHPAHGQLRDLHSQLTDRLHAEIVAGATVHRRVARPVRVLPWTVAVLDGLVLYTFCADVFNVRTADLGRQGLAALALAILGSGITYAWLSITGLRLRDYRTALGEIAWRDARWLTWALLAGAAVIAVTLGVLMYERVAEQAASAGTTYVAPDQVGVLAWVFAILSGCANLTVVAVHVLDGSALGAQARHAGRAVRRAERRLERARRRAWRDAVRAQACPDPLDERTGTEGVRHIA